MVLIPSKQGKYSNATIPIHGMSYQVLIPSKQGKYSNMSAAVQ